MKVDSALTLRRFVIGVALFSALALLVLFSPPLMFAACFAIVCAVALWEYLALLGALVEVPYPVAIFVGGMLVHLSITASELSVALCTAAVVTASILSACTLFGKELRAVVLGAGAALLGSLSLAISIGLVVVLRGKADGVLAVGLVLVGTYVREVSLLCFGHFLPVRPIRAEINPRKGYIGWFVGSVVVGLTLTAFHVFLQYPTRFADVLVFTLLIGWFGQAGDLYMSAIKRLAGARHSGVVFGEQGGALDSVDSLVFTMPVCFMYIAVTTGAAG